MIGATVKRDWRGHLGEAGRSNPLSTQTQETQLTHRTKVSSFSLTNNENEDKA